MVIQGGLTGSGGGGVQVEPSTPMRSSQQLVQEPGSFLDTETGRPTAAGKFAHRLDGKWPVSSDGSPCVGAGGEAIREPS